MILVRPAQCLPKSLVGLAEPREGSRELASTRRHSASSGPCDIRDSWRSRLVSVRCDQLHVGVRAIGHDLPLLRWFVAQSISVLAGQIVAHRSNWTPQSTCSESLALFWPHEFRSRETHQRLQASARGPGREMCTVWFDWSLREQRSWTLSQQRSCRTKHSRLTAKPRRR